MPATKTPTRANSKRPAAARKRAAAPPTRRPAAISRPAEFPDEVLKSVESGQRAAIDAVRKFIDKVDEALPRHEESRRQEVIDSALDMAEKLVHTQYEFLRKVVDSAAKSLSREDGAK